MPSFGAVERQPVPSELFGPRWVGLPGRPSAAARRCPDRFESSGAALEDDALWAHLVETIQSAAEGRATFAPAVVSRVAHRIKNLTQANSGGAVSEQQSLSDRETEVAHLVTMWLAQKQVARRLGVKTPTVKSHLRSILRKLHLRGRRRDLM